jgi:tRNA 2-thiouridine synthesizing protein C
MHTARRVLVICRNSAGEGPRAREALDIALAFGAFDQPVTLLFCGEGVRNLVAGQAGEATHSLERLLGALPDYGIEPLLVHAQALAERGIREEHLVGNCQLLGQDAVASLISDNDLVFSA